MKNRMGIKKVSFLAALLSVCAFPLSAQMFDASAPVAGQKQSQAAPATSAANAGNRAFNNSWANPRKRTVAAPAQKPAEAPKSVTTQNPVAQDAPMPRLSVDRTGAQRALEARQNAAKELDRSLKGKRGTGVIRQVTMPGQKQPDDEGLIFLFYKDFNVSRTMSGMVMCDVKFIVVTTLENKINNLSFRLKWPGIETTLSFNEVAPNVETYFNYTLVGDGCYTMDKIPNVIVNRCRVKGMSQKECANKIRWLKK